MADEFLPDAAVNALDRHLDSLFAPVRPGASMESRLVYALRNVRPTPKYNRARKTFIWATAATVGLGTIGAGLSMLDLDELPMPGIVSAKDNRMAQSAALHGEIDAIKGKQTYGLASAGSPAVDRLNAESYRNGRDYKLIEDQLRRLNSQQDARVMATVTGSVDGVVKQLGEGEGVRTWANDFEAKNNERFSGLVTAPGAPPAGAVNGTSAPANPFSAFYWNPMTLGISPPKGDKDGGGKPGEPSAEFGYFVPTDSGVNKIAPGTGGPSAVTRGFGAQPFEGASRGAKLPQSGVPGPVDTPTSSSPVVVNPIAGLDDLAVRVKSKKELETFNPLQVAAKPTGTTPQGTDSAQAKPAQAPPAARKIVIRSGEMEFEVDSFDTGVTLITGLVAPVPGAYVSTVNSEKLPNGKVRGTIVVRIPPDKLDQFVLDLRRDLGKMGELKGQKIGSQDITKQYTDLESRLKAARAMEERLLKIIQEGKGTIKELLEAEKELGVWRTKIEEIEGELRYYGSLAAMSTLSVTLAEKEIRASVGITENERVTTGVEVEDVEVAFRTVQTLVAEAKGRVTKSELKQHGAGQFSATLHFEIAPESAGPVRDRLKQLGRVARLEIDRAQQSDGGQAVAKDAKVKRGDTQFFLELYNLANISPRETATLSIAATDVPAAYQALRDAVAKANGRVLVATMNEQDRQNITASLHFEVKRTEEAAIQAAFAAAGDLLSRNVVRSPEGKEYTDTKLLYKLSLGSADRVRPRETNVLAVAAVDVVAAHQTLRDAVAKAGGRVLTTELNERDKQNVTAALSFEVKRAEEPAVRAVLDALGDTIGRNVTRAEGEATTDAKVLFQVAMSSASRLKPRESATLSLEVTNVTASAATIAAQAAEAKARQLDARTDHNPDGRVTAHLLYDVPLAAAPAFTDQVKAAGKVRVSQSVRDPQAPDGKLATARVEVTLTNVEAIVGPEEGIWPKVKQGLSYSAKLLLSSLTWIVFALCAILPWAAIGFGGYKLVKRVVRTDEKPAPLSPAPPAESGGPAVS